MSAVGVAPVRACKRPVWVAAIVSPVLAMVAVSSPAHAQWASWDQPAHIREVASELAPRVRQNGPAATFSEIAQCYSAQEQAITLGKALEKCLIEDMVHSWVTADMFARAAKDNPANRMPPPESVLEAMSGRLIAVFRRYRVPENQALEFMQAVRQQGLPAYAQAVQPR